MLVSVSVLKISPEPRPLARVAHATPLWRSPGAASQAARCWAMHVPRSPSQRQPPVLSVRPGRTAGPSLGCRRCDRRRSGRPASLGASVDPDAFRRDPACKTSAGVAYRGRPGRIGHLAPGVVNEGLHEGCSNALSAVGARYLDQVDTRTQGVVSVTVVGPVEQIPAVVVADVVGCHTVAPNSDIEIGDTPALDA